MTSSISELLTARLRTDGDKPLITAYDRVTGERTELSVATADNWVSKTANFLDQDLGVGRGEPLGLLLGTHWATAVTLLACWRMGAVPVAGRAAVAAAAPPATLVTEERADEAAGLSGELVVIGRGMGARLSPAAGEDARGMVAFADEVLAFADDYAEPVTDASAPAWADPPLTQARLLQRAADWPHRARVLTTVPAGRLEGAVALVGAVAGGGSLVLLRADDGGDPAAGASEHGRVAEDEHATHLHVDAHGPRPL